MKNKTLAIILALAVPLTVGAAFETTVGNPVNVYSGANSTSTTATSYTLVLNDILGYSSILMTPNTGSLTLTLPASSTMSSWLPNSGDNLVFLLYNASSTSGINITLAAGSGTLLESASSSVVTGSSKYSVIRAMRKPNSDFLFNISVAQ